MWKSDYEHDQHLFYKYFFDWGKDVQKTRKTSKTVDDGESNEGMSQMNEAETKAETKKLAMFKMSQEMQEFLDNGGFPKVLKDIFNPTDPTSMELDSVFQLK